LTGSTCSSSTCVGYCDICGSANGLCTRCLQPYGLSTTSSSCYYTQSGSCQWKVTDDTSNCPTYNLDVNCQYSYKAQTSTNKTCTSCVNGYYFDVTSSLCQACQPGCLQCTQSQLPPVGYLTCTSPAYTNAQGFIRMNGTVNGTNGDVLSFNCSSGCAQCLDYTATCSVCLPGYQLWVAQDTGIVKCLPNTQACSIPDINSQRCWVTSWNSATTILVNILALFVVKYLYLA